MYAERRDDGRRIGSCVYGREVNSTKTRASTSSNTSLLERLCVILEYDGPTYQEPERNHSEQHCFECRATLHSRKCCSEWQQTLLRLYEGLLSLGATISPPIICLNAIGSRCVLTTCTGLDLQIPRQPRHRR